MCKARLELTFLCHLPGAFALLLVFFSLSRLSTGTIVGERQATVAANAHTAFVEERKGTKAERSLGVGEGKRRQRRVGAPAGPATSSETRVERRRRRREGRMLLQSADDDIITWRKGTEQWRVPQSTCPGSTSRVSLSKGAPGNRAVREKIQELLMEQAEGRLRTTSRNGTVLGHTEVNDAQGSCVFLTQNCANPDNAYGRRMSAKMEEAGVKGYGRSPAGLKKWDQKRRSLINLGPGSLGSCALVANSENMLKGKRGADIDAHDTVFRHNTPVRGFEQHVGKRSTIIWNKSTYQSKSGQGVPELAHALLMNIDKVPPSFRYKSKHIFLRAGAANPLARDRRAMYRLLGRGSRKHPSGGFSRPLNILASKLCTRVDLYGFSGLGGGKYFSKGAKVRAAHDMPFEHWAYRWLMSKGKLCVYGD